MDPRPDCIPLDALVDPDPARHGGKAATLARLAAAGLPVPTGVVIPVDVAGAPCADLDALARAVVAALGDGPLAVRSSAVDEDLADRSFAGQYETVLGVAGPAEVAAAIASVLASAGTSRVDAYAPERDAGVAVLVQQLVAADAAGVAFTADPLTGERHVTVIEAVAGLGDALVSGEAAGERWQGDGGDLRCTGTPTVLTPTTAAAVAALVRRVADHEADRGPQDIEWALHGDEVWLLQARPMTALPDEVTWDTLAPGWWRRDFRFGEWLPEPVTPLFASWFFPAQEAGFVATVRRHVGGAPEGPFHVIVNGWCYCSLGRFTRAMFGGMFRRSPLGTLRTVAGHATVGRKPALGERAIAAPARAVYEAELLPAYERAVAEAATRVDGASPTELVELVDGLVAHVGALTWPMVDVLGYAGKAEFALAALHRRHLEPVVGGTPLTLLAGLREPVPSPPHAVTSLDWSRPTLGELDTGAAATAPAADRHARVVAEREAHEAACRRALAGDRRLAARFDQYLGIAQRYGVVREEMATAFTLAWPVLRRAIARLGEELVARGAVTERDDVHWLERSELEAAADGAALDLRATVDERRATWARQARLVPPISVGDPSPIHARVEAGVAATRPGGTAADADVVGTPASAGVATGPARIVQGPGDFDRVRDGDVLVAPVTAPAWTPLFGRIAAVVTDGGSAAAHASLIAREYGIPAVVGTGDATRRLRDGALVTVDGTRGVLTVHDGA